MGFGTSHGVAYELLRTLGRDAGLQQAARWHLVHGHFPPLDPRWSEIAVSAIREIRRQREIGEIDYRAILTVDMGDGNGPQEAGMLGVALRKLSLDPLISALDQYDAEVAEEAEEAEEEGIGG